MAAIEDNLNLLLLVIKKKGMHLNQQENPQLSACQIWRIYRLAFNFPFSHTYGLSNFFSERSVRLHAEMHKSVTKHEASHNNNLSTIIFHHTWLPNIKHHGGI